MRRKNALESLPDHEQYNPAISHTEALLILKALKRQAAAQKELIEKWRARGKRGFNHVRTAEWLPNSNNSTHSS